MEEVRPHRGVALRHRGLVRPRPPARIRDQDVEAFHAFETALEQPPDIGRAGDVGDHRPPFTPLRNDRVRDALHLARGPCGADDERPFPREGERDRLPDPPPRTGDEGDLAGQTAHRVDPVASYN